MANAKWVSQQILATELGIKIQTVNHWIKRGNISWKILEGTNFKLVDKTSITVNKYKTRVIKS